MVGCRASESCGVHMPCILNPCPIVRGVAGVAWSCGRLSEGCGWLASGVAGVRCGWLAVWLAGKRGAGLAGRWAIARGAGGGRLGASADVGCG